LIKKALDHKGFTYLEVFSPCVTFGRATSYQWFREHLINVDELPNYDKHDWEGVMKFLAELPIDVYAVGLIYETKEQKTLREKILPGVETPIIDLDLDPKRNDYEEIIEKYM
jgi:2-oxoglutarate ferredoxin oxidoreductase subunit beta